ncbi:Nucleoside-diphosphate-sugar epimerase [Fodinibius salinus]|uniref:Nucleoside-diphosphate-sugar epimerase n=1 Tax=Fodinibius salinus TaxID=860790 RepID=A0A5D3YHQ6_9BACT|nr:SDR family oxidoreductase [Fodinibius salinus]TYP93303.1 Nucleoside-diphosphate-sugar epimerase [Fodinibius salinus]
MTISILGCGWLGLPLAENLRDSGHTVKGSTTSAEKLNLLRNKNITPFLLELTPQIECEECNDFWDSDLLVLNIPPGRGRDNIEEYHLQQINTVAEQLSGSPIDRLIFISSTSVYPPQPGIVAESDTEKGNAKRPSGNALLKAETLLMEQESFDTTIIRFGGLYGYDRNPAHFLAGRKNVSGGNAPINLIHRDDCIGIIDRIIDKDVRGEIFNGVSDGHPPKNMYYPAAAESLGLEPPSFDENEDKDKNYKVVSNRKLKELLDYRFTYPNPMDKLQLVES